MQRCRAPSIRSRSSRASLPGRMFGGFGRGGGTITYTPSGSFMGSHQILGGLTGLPEDFDINLPLAASGDYRLVFNNGVPTELWVHNNPVKGHATQNQVALYVSDLWRATKRL